jgi:hypothetical protein
MGEVLEGMVMEAEARPTLTLLVNDPRITLKDIAPLLEKACEWSNGEFTPAGVVQGIVEGRFTLLALADDAIRSIMVVMPTVKTYGDGSTLLECLLVAGEDMKLWTPFEPELDALARSAGASALRMIGRKGLLKMLPHWRLAAYVMEKDLTGG